MTFGYGCQSFLQSVKAAPGKGICVREGQAKGEFFTFFGKGSMRIYDAIGATG